MPIVGDPTSSTDYEGFILDGLDLNDNATFRMVSVDFTPPRQRQEWIGAADSEHQALVRDPLHENRKITARIVVVPQADMDAALTQIATANDKLQKASKYTGGIELVWAPASGTFECTFDVLAGEITALPVDPETGWFAYNPEFSIELTCKPYWRGGVVTTSTASSSTPFVTLEIPDVGGDVPALGVLTVTDTATQSRRHVEWGLEGPLTYDPATVLLLDSDSLVTSGFSAVGGTAPGAYDPNATGNSTVTAFMRQGTYALVGTGNQPHVGTFRVKARVAADIVSASVRFAYSAGDGLLSTNPGAAYAGSASFSWRELDLGTITIPEVVDGTQRWTGQVEVTVVGDGGTIHLDYLILIPVSDGYGKARGSYSYSPGVMVGSDSFAATTAGNALHARTAETGGTWATSGATTDFAFSDFTVGAVVREAVSRATTTDASARFGILGSSNYTNVQVETAILTDRGATGATGVFGQGVIARWTDSSNFLRGIAQQLLTSGGSPVQTLAIVQRVAGVDTLLATQNLSGVIQGLSWYALRLTVFASGRAVLWLMNESKTMAYWGAEANTTVLATGGTLATGKPGLYDYCPSISAGVPTRVYDDFAVATPAAEPIALYSGRTLQFRHDDVIRGDATGVYTGRPQSYRGSRFTVPVGTSRVLVKARRNDVEASTNDNVTDATQVGVAYTPRGVAVPR